MPRLINLFRSLSTQEVKQFGQFFQSPYYNATPKARTLYKHLKKKHPKCSFTKEYKEELFVKIFGKEEYSIKKMNNLMASLSSILQDFLLLQHMKNGSIARHKGLFEAYQERNLNKESMQQLRYLHNNFEQQPDATALRYYEQFKLYHDLYFHPDTRLVTWKVGEEHKYLEGALQNLKLFYAHTRMHYLCEINFLGAPTAEFELTPEDDKYFEELIDRHDAPLLEIHRLFYRIQQKPDEEVYVRLKANVFEYIRKYNPKKTSFLLTFLKNYQSNQLRSGNTKALDEMFDLYQFGIEENLYLSERGNFHAVHFLNITILASELGETVWLEEFIKTYKGELKAEEQANTVKLCQAYLHFAKQEYRNTIRLTRQYIRTDAPHALTCWTLEIRAYYMAQEGYEDLENALRYFRAYLNRKDDISEIIKTGNRNFATLIRRLYKADYEKKYSKKTLLKELEQQENIVCKRWLRAQIERLK